MYYNDPMQIDVDYRWPPGLCVGDTLQIHGEPDTLTVVAVDATDRAYVTLADAQGRKREAVIRSAGDGRMMTVWRQAFWG